MPCARCGESNISSPPRKFCCRCQELMNARARQRYATNTEFRERRKEQVRAYQHAHRRQETARQIKYQAGRWEERYYGDLAFKLKTGLRSRMSRAIKTNAKAGSAVRDLGCTIPELKAHLEAQFQPGMTWDNWSLKGWHIDHIKPLTSFDLTDREQFLQACHYTNLQPLWASENLSKGPS